MRPTNTSFAFALVATLTACSEQGFSGIDSENPTDGPAIEVAPTLLDFGTLAQGDPAVALSFTITSVGATDLAVDSLELLGDNGSFTLLSEATEFILPPGASQDIEVAFEPMGAYDQMGQAVIGSNDPEEPQSLVELVGAGAVPELEITPDPADFGETWVGCDDQLDVYLTNVGSDDLRISDLSYGGDEFDVFGEVQGITLPLVLPPGESVQVLLDFWPDDIVPYQGTLEVTSNEPAGTRMGGIIGTGAYAGEYTDLWEIPEDPPSDILFMVDQSCSMDDDQARLASNFSTFISSLDAYTTDWQIMVANDDDGCNNSGILTRSTSGYQSSFQSAVSSGGGNYTESLLTVGTNAVERTDAGECNFTFLRDDAMLHMIFVSDEPEQSGGNWADYLAQIVAKKGSESNVRMSAIAGFGSCGEGSAGYDEVVDATGGVFLDICTSWATTTNLAELAEASVFQDTFELTREPLDGTLTVAVNEVPRTTGWSYDADANTVVFSEMVPTEGDEVEISYAGIAVCD